MKKISLTIDSDASFTKALSELEVYKSKLESKVAVFNERVAQELRDLAQQIASSAFADYYWPKKDPTNLIQDRANVSITVESSGDTSLVIMSGEDALWIEFGTGVLYNGAAGSSPHPKGSELGMTIGGYGKGKGKRRKWAFNKDGVTYFTHGIPAFMPMWKAAQETRARLEQIGREVFGND